ncbi:hypothetical protein PSI14_00435 [Xenorhabdus sp. XENO-2]|uniref:Uncharacterized protein n=1 Tax=Xenorhabdus anantnagensis TaxID=3025875 RepID=A0ABT5LM51_9GAMM|nr:hypothetical protein [Xenorhabdus anantnagensis]MDC9595375.1 hypothetical protein [Xenorhabdus anantnagensis]
MGESLLGLSGYIKFFMGLFALVNPVGDSILCVFGISIDLFRIADGMLIITIAVI